MITLREAELFYARLMFVMLRYQARKLKKR